MHHARALGRLVAAALVAALACGEADDAATASATTAAESSATTADDSTGESEDSGASVGPDDTASTNDPDTSSSTGTDTGTSECTLPDPAPAWLEDDVRDIVARLTGELEIEPGVTLPDRATATTRARTADWLHARFDALGLVGERHDNGTGSNVFAVVPATDTADGTLVFGAHFDTVPGSPGANDNATGVAVALALARQLLALPCRRYDVIVVLFDEEEIGLVGSAAFAEALVDADEPVIAVHTIDQQGWDADGDRRIEVERPDEGLLEFYAEAALELADPMELVPTETGATDHVSFRAVGFAAVGLTEEYVSGDTTPHYHAPSDTYDTVDFDYLVSGATLVNHAFARALAGS